LIPKKSNRGGPRPGSGRPPGAHNKATADIRALAQDHSPRAITELARIMLNSESDTARVAAIKEMLDRAYGKSVQAVQSLDEHGNPAGAAPTMKVIVQLVGDAPAPREQASNRPALTDAARRNVQLVG
jgi:hypothetical protein